MVSNEQLHPYCSVFLETFWCTYSVEYSTLKSFTLEKKKKGLWEIQGTRMTKRPQHRNRAARFSFCRALASPCRCIHTLLSFQFASCGFLCLMNPPGKKLQPGKLFSMQKMMKECRGWKAFTIAASKWIDTIGMLNHHIYSPCHSEEVQKTKCLLS